MDPGTHERGVGRRKQRAGVASGVAVIVLLASVFSGDAEEPDRLAAPESDS